MAAVRADLLLCDSAQNVQGKVYALGLGWNQVLSDIPTFTSVVALIYVPYDLTNVKFHGEVSLMTEDGAPYPSEQAAVVAFDFEVGRPPGMKPGEEQIVPFAGNINGLVFAPGGYRWEVEINGEPVASASFMAKPKVG